MKARACVLQPAEALLDLVAASKLFEAVIR